MRRENKLTDLHPLLELRPLDSWSRINKETGFGEF